MNELPEIKPCPKCGALDISTDSRRWFCECGWSEPIRESHGITHNHSAGSMYCPHPDCDDGETKP